MLPAGCRANSGRVAHFCAALLAPGVHILAALVLVKGLAPPPVPDHPVPNHDAPAIRLFTPNAISPAPIPAKADRPQPQNIPPESPADSRQPSSNKDSISPIMVENLRSAPILPGMISMAARPLLPRTVSPAPAPTPVPTSPPPQTEDDPRPAYQARIWRHIALHRPRGIYLSGAALICFTLTPEGKLLSAEMIQGSGNKRLDSLAIRTIRNAAPFPRPPGDMQDPRDLTFTIAFRFD